MLFWCDKTLNFVPNFSLANCRRVSPDERCSRHAQVCISELEEVVRKHLEFDSILQHGFQCTSTRMWDCGVCFCLENPIDLKIQTRLGSLKLLVNCVDWDLGWKDVDLLRFAGLKTVFWAYTSEGKRSESESVQRYRSSGSLGEALEELMLDEKQTSDTPRDVACRWLQNHDEWQDWLPGASLKTRNWVKLWKKMQCKIAASNWSNSQFVYFKT